MKKIFSKVALAAIFLITGGFARGQDMAATTGLISSVITDIAKNKIEVATLVPPGSCPGHFDLKGGDLETIERSGILLAHGNEEYLGKIKMAVGIRNFAPIIIEIEGNWLVPERQREAYGKIFGILCGKFPQYRIFFEKNREKVVEEIDKTDREIKNLAAAAKLKGIPVICNNHISEILEYIGFEVAATYGRKEELTPASIKNLIAVCREKNVRMVIDNLQAGPDTGKVMADELKIPHLAISNFPGVFPETPTLRRTLREDVKRILAVYENAQNTVD